MKKNILLTFIMLISISINAQETEEVVIDSAAVVKKSYMPNKGQFTVAMNFGRSAFLTSGLVASTNTVSGVPATSALSTTNNDATNMIGAEGRYFVSKNWALTLGGGIAYSRTPSSLNIPAVLDDNLSVVLPAYNAVVSQTNLDISYSVGALYFFNYESNKRLLPYLGFAIPVNHATRSVYDPTISVTDAGNVTINDLGASSVNVNGIGLQAVAGVDYFLTDNIYFGLNIRPLSFMQVNTRRYPGPGLITRKISNTSFSAFVQPMLSIGFKL